MRLVAVLVLALFAVACRSLPSAGGAAAGFERLVEGKRRLPGFLDLYVDAQGGRVLAAVPVVEGRLECLYVEGLTTGIGSNPVGLDRGKIGPTRLVTWRRVGKRLLVEQANQSFRATSDDGAELRAARESFATSVLWAGEVLAERADGALLVDLTGFAVRDAHGVARTLAARGQGKFALDAARSAIDPAACLAFPDNVELEAVLTFAGEEPGAEVRATAPEPTALSLVQHHSLIRLPDPGYRPRAYDPRSGTIALRFLDYGAGLDEPLARAYAVRHRLEKVDPRSERSRAVEPIVYHVDRGAPEPVRAALIEGARWWAAAFEAAGFEDAFRVEPLPEGAHPLDVRYNVIQWVHRSTRGWSYGGGIVDPRTGEMVKGHVTLGSLRVRQDRLLFEGLAGTEKTGTGAPDDPIELALARIRQLSAHEVGHTLGFAHNFAASTNGRASVMDYPAPLVGLAGGELDFSEAYGQGVGAWDLVTTRWAYSEFPDGAQERTLLDAILEDAFARGLRYLSDEDARAPGSAQPLGSLWDNGGDAAAELERLLAVRRFALERFGARNLPAGQPLAHLQEVLAPLYFHHRYQVEAAAKAVGGLEYAHELGGEGARGVLPLAGDEQRRALRAVLAALDPRELDLPEHLLARLPPRPPGEPRSGELFSGATAPAFDPLAAAASAAELVVGALLQRERAARLVDLHRRDARLPGLEEVLDELVVAAFPERAPADLRQLELRRVVQRVVADGFLRLAADGDAPARVRSRVEQRLAELAERIVAFSAALPDGAGVEAGLARDIERFLARPHAGVARVPEAPAAPPGSPIGSAPEPFGACAGGGH